jgi:predicted porin
MQKKIIALAVAGLVSSAAFAQSNVTIYGVMDLGYVNSSASRPGTGQLGRASQNYSGIDSGLDAGSRIGFKGEEGLGNGLKTVFAIEYYIVPDENQGLGSAPTGAGGGVSGSVTRQAYVGLNHAKLGTVSMGRQYAPGFGASVRNDGFAGTGYAPLGILNGAGKNTIAAGSAARINNSIAYTSPNWSGFTATAVYGFGEGTASSASLATDQVSQGSNGVIAVGLNYANGPLNLDAVYQSRQGLTGTAVAGTVGIAAAPAAIAGLTTPLGSVATGDSVNEWMLAGSYDFKVVKLFASYQDQNDNNGTSAQEASNRVWQVGATVPVFTNGKVRISYADLDWDRTNGGGSKAWGLGYQHSLSKRTTLYTSYIYADNDKSVVAAAGPVTATALRGTSSNTIVGGITHSF